MKFAKKYGIMVDMNKNKFLFIEIVSELYNVYKSTLCNLSKMEKGSLPMIDNIIISGFADEIDPQLDVQLKVVRELGMDHICLRAADGKGVADYTPEEFAASIAPRLEAAGVKLSSLGSPIGKIGIHDEEGYAKQLAQLESLCQICKLSGCRYIRMFSFWMPKGENPDDYTDLVLQKLAGFAKVAEKYDVILIHENEKDIYGDIARRCKVILDRLASPHFKAAFDFANFVQCGEDTEKCWEMLKEHVVYIHIKDAVRGNNENVLCGTGDGKIPQLLKTILRRDGYRGFLTLEPHLVLFDTLQSLETEDASKVIAHNKAKNGAEGYAMQYHALLDILKTV